MEEDSVWMVIRSPLDPRVWVPVPTGWGDQALITFAGGLRAVKGFCEREEWPDGTHWARRDADTHIAVAS